MFQFMYNLLLKQSDYSHDLQQIPSVIEDNTAYQQTHQRQLCGSTGPILGYLCRNGVSCTFEILILKPPLWLNLLRVSLLDPVPVSSEYRAVCVDITRADSIPSL